MAKWFASLLGIAISAAAWAGTLDSRFAFEIPAQGVASALLKFSEQVDLQVMTASADLKDVRSPGVRGERTVREALGELLGGTGLKFRVVAENAVAIERVGKGNTAQAGTDDSPADVRVAQAEGSSTGSAPEGGKNEELREVQVAIPEILVKGSRVLNTDIRRSRDSQQPYVVIDRNAIERSGAANVDELLRKQLTMSTSPVSPSQEGRSFGSVSSINLRGLGADETLVLIDGRRAEGFGSTAGAQQPDLNGIPLAAIERIEVLPATASGIYGGGATGGVVNVVLRRDYSGVEGKATYGNTFDSNGATRRIDLASGFSLENGKTNVLLAASWADADSLLLGNRDFAQRARAQVLAVNSNAIFGSANPPFGATTNIRSATTVGGVLQPLTLKNGGAALNSTFTSVPYGYAGLSSDNGAALIANAGRYNLDMPLSAQSGNAVRGNGVAASLTNAPIVKSFMGTVRRPLASSVDAFLEISASKNSAFFESLPSLSGMLISNTRPGNPFNQSIRVVTPTLGIEGNTRSDIESQRAVAGVIIELPAAWSLGLDYTWNRTKNSGSSPVGFSTSAAAAAVGTGALNVFRDTNAFPVDLEPFALQTSFSTPSRSTLKDGAARLSGHLPFSLPGGQPTLSALLEHRTESADDQFFITEIAPGTFNRILAPSASQDIDSVYAEALLPIVSAASAFAGVKLFELQLSGRYDRYRTDGVPVVNVDGNLLPLDPIVRTRNRVSSTDPTIALRYAPVSDLTLRGSYGTGFLPPSVSQLVPTAAQTLGNSNGLTDPLRNNELIGSFLSTTGGNPDLKPEESESRSAGFILAPHAVPGLRVSVDYVDIEKKNNITGVSQTQQDLDNLIAFAPDRITRAPSSGGVIGPITGLNLGLVNLARLRVRSYDVAGDYQFDTGPLGSFALRLAATRLISLRTQITEAAPTVEYAGVGTAANVGNAFDGGGLKWRANAGVTWRLRDATLGWMARYYDSYFLNAEHAIDPNQGSAAVPSQVYHDLFASWHLPRLFGGGTEIQFGVNNLFNKEPPVDVVGRGFGSLGYSYYGDPRLANYYLTLKSSFGK